MTSMFFLSQSQCYWLTEPIHLSILLLPAANSFEKKYDPIPVLDWMRARPMVPVAAVALYGFFIVFGQLAMRNRDAWNWRRTMAFWNLGLSLFSWIGMSRTLPNLVHNFSTMSVRDNFCSDPQSSYGGGSTGLWVQLFILSKFPYVHKNNDSCLFSFFTKKTVKANNVRCPLYIFCISYNNLIILYYLIPVYANDNKITVNSLIHFSLWFIRNRSFSYIGIIISLFCYIAGILMLPNPLQVLSLLQWITVSMQRCTDITSWWQ